MSRFLKKCLAYRVLFFIAIGVAWTWTASLSEATVVVSNNGNALSLASALASSGGQGIVITNATLSRQSSTSASSTGIFSADGSPYGLFGTGIVLSTGNASSYSSGPNTTSQFTTNYGVSASVAQNALLSPLSGQASHFDVTELVLTFDMLPGFDRVYVNAVFGSEEFPEFVNSSFVDALGIFVNGVNFALEGGLPVNSRLPGLAALPGTELDGVLAPGGLPLRTYSAFVGNGAIGNTLRLIIADSVDASVDSTVYLSALGGSPGNVIPEPTSLVLWGIGMWMGGWRRRRSAHR